MCDEGGAVQAALTGITLCTYTVQQRYKMSSLQSLYMQSQVITVVKCWEMIVEILPNYTKQKLEKRAYKTWKITRMGLRKTFVGPKQQ